MQLAIETTGYAFDGVCPVFQHLLACRRFPLWVVVGVWFLWSNYMGKGGRGGEGEGERDAGWAGEMRRKGYRRARLA